MTKTLSRSLYTMLAFPIFLLCGCGSDAPDLAPTTGKVTYNGQPVENASVMFTPVGKGSPSTAQTDAQGAFKMVTLDKEGAAVGENTVTIAKMENEPGARDPNAGRSAPSLTPQISLIPAKYGHPEQSGLKATVNAGEDNTFTFDLVD